MMTCQHVAIDYKTIESASHFQNNWRKLGSQQYVLKTEILNAAPILIGFGRSHSVISVAS